jgi:hypothetical protein
MVCIFYAHKKAATAATKGENQRIRIKCLARLARRMGKVLQEVGETLGNENQPIREWWIKPKVRQRRLGGNARNAAREVQLSHKNAATDKAHEQRNKISQCKMPKRKPTRRSSNSRSAIQPNARGPARSFAETP